MVGPAWLACGSKLGIAVILRLRKTLMYCLSRPPLSEPHWPAPRECVQITCAASTFRSSASRSPGNSGHHNATAVCLRCLHTTAGRFLILHVHTGLV